MSDALSIAVSGLLAQSTKLAATANNIANISTVGALPTATAPHSTVYKPLQVSFSTIDSGGVFAAVSAKPNGYSAAYDPTSNYANSGGFVAAPNVDLVQESVNLIETKLLYKANLAVIKTQDELLGDLFDTMA